MGGSGEKAQIYRYRGLPLGGIRGTPKGVWVGELFVDIDAAKDFLTRHTAETSVQAITNLRYHSTYGALLALGQAIEDDARHSGLLTLSCGVYAWMPTILKTFEPDAFNEDAPVAKIRESNTAAAAVTFLAAMEKRAPLNGSWIGTSKLLHMLNPEVFPIWDGRVAARFGPISDYSINLKKTYIYYVQFLHAELAHRQDVIWGIRDHIMAAHGYKATDLRCLELLLFSKDPDESVSKALGG